MTSTQQMPTTAMGESNTIEVVIKSTEPADVMKQPNVREFIRRIYFILSVQLALTVGIAFACIHIPALNNFVHKHIASIALIVCGLLICCMVALLLQVCLRRMSTTTLAAIYAVLAICMGIIVALTVVGEVAHGAGDIVLKAFVITLVAFVALTIFTFQTRIDFTFLGGFLFIATLALCAFGFLACIIQSVTLQLVLSLIGALLFSLWILYDTSVILERSKYLEHGQVPSWRESFIYATNLYVDIMQLFLYILDLLRIFSR